MFSAVVFSAGRTGGHLIVNNLKHYFKTPYVDHSHNALIDLPFDDSIAVVSKRRNLFDAIVSMFVASRIDQFHWTTIEPVVVPSFEVSKLDFENLFYFQTIFNQVIDQRPFVQKVEIYYEDMLEDSNYLMKQFGINEPMLHLIKKSPYNASSSITNINQLQEWYNQLVDQPISEDQVNFWKLNIEKQLSNIQKNHNGNKFKEKISRFNQ
jgi:hypothetical protein